MKIRPNHVSHNSSQSWIEAPSSQPAIADLGAVAIPKMADIMQIISNKHIIDAQNSNIAKTKTFKH